MYLYFTTTGAWLDFTYTTTYRAPDNMWGEYENGSWNGLLGEVYHGDKDVTTNYFTLTEHRLQHFDGSVPYSREGYCYINLHLISFKKLSYSVHIM